MMDEKTSHRGFRSETVIFVIALCVLLIPVVPCSAQTAQDQAETLKSQALRIFFDCDRCDEDYVRTEVTFVNYVRDRKEGQVHVMVTTQRTGAGGREYTFNFIGQLEYAGQNDTLTYVSQQFSTEDEIRQGIVRALKMGLMRYVARTPLADQINISFRQRVSPTAVVDKWDYWVFRINVRNFLQGEKSNSSLQINTNFSANRTTPNWKMRFGINTNYNENKFETSEGTVKSISRWYGNENLIVKSLNDHWSTGMYLSINSSTYNNIKTELSVAPAIEYNLFPYAESTRRELRVLYRIGVNPVDYIEETLFGKTAQTLYKESLSVTLETKQPWGTVEATLIGSHFFHDFSKNRITLFSELSLRLYKGLSFDIWGNVQQIHDQLSLQKGELSDEEILLRRQQQATSFRYFGSIGVSYTFGSIYSNVVNPRFGGGSRFF